MLQRKSQHVKKKCRICPHISFQSENDYLLHIRDEHESKVIACHMCSVCGKTFKTSGQLTQHMESKCGTERKFKCKECGKKFMSAGSLHNHRKKHNEVAKLMCRFCAKLFLLAGQLKVHEKSHLNEKDYICEICGKAFCHRQSLITHISVHTGVKPYQCEGCSKTFSCVGNLLKHKRTHNESCGAVRFSGHRMQNSSTKIKVKINTPASSYLKKTKDQKVLEEKLSKINTEETKEELDKKDEALNDFTKDDIGGNRESNDEDDTDCQVTQDEYSNKATEEINHHHNTSNSYVFQDGKVKSFVPCKKKRSSSTHPQLANLKSDTNLEIGEVVSCEYCKKEYTNLVWLRKHEDGHRKNGKLVMSIYRCCHCKKVYSSKIERKKHQLVDHPDLLTCNDCNKIFANADTLKSHYNVFHKGISRKNYTYICEKCGKSFKRKALFEVHRTSNCDSISPFQCDICNKNFKTHHSKKLHMNLHTPKKSYQCRFCGKQFHWQGQLKVHIRSHTGEKPYTCLFCPKAFAYRDSLITHSTIHTGIKPYVCESCGWRFSCVGNLAKHKATHATTCGAWYIENETK